MHNIWAKCQGCNPCDIYARERWIILYIRSGPRLDASASAINVGAYLARHAIYNSLYLCNDRSTGTCKCSLLAKVRSIWWNCLARFCLSWWTWWHQFTSVSPYERPWSYVLLTKSDFISFPSFEPQAGVFAMSYGIFSFLRLTGQGQQCTNMPGWRARPYLTRSFIYYDHYELLNLWYVKWRDLGPSFSYPCHVS